MDKKYKYKLLSLCLLVIFLCLIVYKFTAHDKDKLPVQYNGKFLKYYNKKGYDKICIIGGGLGNQMFIYSFGYSFIKQTNQSFAYDITIYPKNPKKIITEYL